MKAIWLAPVPPEAKEDYRKQLLLTVNSQLVLRLKDILQERLSSLEGSELQPNAYDNPNWAYKQAHSNGMKHSLKLILDLLDFKEG